MISIDIMGGLGNQLFQIMTVIAYSKKYNNPFVIERKAFSPSCTFRNVYWDNFLSKLERFLVNHPVYLPVYQEPSFEYKALPVISSADTIKLSGYFQSYKYFDAYKNEILKEIGYDDIKSAFIKKMNQNHRMNPEEMISLHFRMGDIIKVHRDNHIILPVEYYINAVKYIITKTNNPHLKLLYFCEAEDNAFVETNYINHLRELFPNTSYHKASDTIEDWEQLVWMSLCEHHILANSTFSWWGAYLATDSDNSNNKKVICYPDKWQHSNIINNSTVDLFPDHWTKCKADAEVV